MESEFNKIYETNFWGSQESVSGAGSTVSYTKKLRQSLPPLFSEFRIKSILDAPCGDFNWMKLVVEETNICYIGGEIVKELVARNQELYARDGIEFVHLDITKDSVPHVDLWMCRDCLIHLPYSGIRGALENFLASETPYFLTTTHINDVGFKNKDIAPGEFRYLDLFSPPFSLTKLPLIRVSDWELPYRPCEMILLGRDHVEEIHANLTNLQATQ